MRSIPIAILRELERAYATPPRAYHNLDHIEAVLALHAEVESAIGWEAPIETFWALAFHDAIYVAGRKDNEENSARFAGEILTREQQLCELDRVEALILLTARHGKLRREDVDRDAALFVDCDMAILGAPEAAFDAYESGIAEEYSSTPKILYRLGRKRFLEKLLAAPAIYLSDWFRDRLELRARENIQRALDAL
jgi:predicted metal-dependent HD superfamily phosphohydrolase